MKLINLINRLEAKDVYKEWIKINKNITLEILEKLFIELRAKEVVYSKNKLKIEKDESSKSYYPVIIEDTEEYSLAFVPWKDLLGMDILSYSTFLKEKVLFYILYELTFDGFTELEMEKSKKELMEIISDFEKHPENAITSIDDELFFIDDRKTLKLSL